MTKLFFGWTYSTLYYINPYTAYNENILILYKCSVGILSLWCAHHLMRQSWNYIRRNKQQTMMMMMALPLYFIFISNCIYSTKLTVLGGLCCFTMIAACPRRCIISLGRDWAIHVQSTCFISLYIYPFGWVCYIFIFKRMYV